MLSQRTRIVPSGFVTWRPWPNQLLLIHILTLLAVQAGKGSFIIYIKYNVFENYMYNHPPAESLLKILYIIHGPIRRPHNGAESVSWKEIRDRL